MLLQRLGVKSNPAVFLKEGLKRPRPPFAPVGHGGVGSGTGVENTPQNTDNGVLYPTGTDTSSDN